MFFFIYIRMMSGPPLFQIDVVCFSFCECHLHGVQLEQRTFLSKHYQIIYSYFCFFSCVSYSGQLCFDFKVRFFITFGKDANNYQNYQKDPITFFHQFVCKFSRYCHWHCNRQKTCLFFSNIND